MNYDEATITEMWGNWKLKNKKQNNRGQRN